MRWWTAAAGCSGSTRSPAPPAASPTAISIPGPGIRCLLEGTFNAEQAGHSARDLYPGDAWWETGPDTVVAWGSQQMPAKFLRGMVLPVEWEGKVTGTWLDSPGRRSNWRLLVDKIIAV